MQHLEQQISSIAPQQPQNHNDSIINQLNLLSNSDESRVVKIESFIYAQESKASQTPYKHLHQSFLHDHQGNIIPPIEYQPSYFNHSPKQQKKAKNRIKNVKSIRDEIMQENQILQQRLNQNKHYITSFPSPRFYTNLSKDKNYLTSKPGQWEGNGNKQAKQVPKQSKMDEIFAKLQEQYNESKVIRLYNFIIKELPRCSTCQRHRTHLSKQQNGVSLQCKECNSKTIRHPLIGILYDLENKSRFQEEIAAYQTVLDKVTQQIDTLKQQIASLQILKEKIATLKNLNRKKYKQINESKFYLKKHVQNLQQHHLIELQKLIPKEYLQQMQLWGQIKQNYRNFMDKSLGQIYKIMPIHLHDEMNNKFMSNLHKVLNYEKEQAVKISISEHIKFPMKKIDSAVFVVDGSYSLPVFENIRHLHLEFQNKKTMRELNLLFTNFPNQIYSLSFAYNHKIHSHISAQTFPFLKHIAPIESIKKIDITIENMKDFDDLLGMGSSMTPKKEIKLNITKHIFSKSNLYLPINFYTGLINRLGSQVSKIELHLPESADSPALINYEQLIGLRFLTTFKITRGEKHSKQKRKMKILQEVDNSQKQKKMELVFKKLLATKINFLRLIKAKGANNKVLIIPMLSFLS